MSKKEKLQGKRGSGPPVAPTIAPSKAPQWTREHIEALVQKDLANLRSNAEKRGEEEIVNLCVLVQTERRTAQRTSLRHRKQEISKSPEVAEEREAILGLERRLGENFPSNMTSAKRRLPLIPREPCDLRLRAF